jgi:DNA repair exonuclease SbcCD ATPase subunit
MAKQATTQAPTAPATKKRLEDFPEWNEAVARLADLQQQQTANTKRIRELQRHFESQPSIEAQADALARGDAIEAQNVERLARELKEAEERYHVLELAVPKAKDLIEEVRRKLSVVICDAVLPEYKALINEYRRANSVASDAFDIVSNFRGTLEGNGVTVSGLPQIYR